MGLEPPWSVRILQTGAAHQPRDAFAPTGRPRRRAFGRHPRDSIGPTARSVDRDDARGQVRIGPRPQRRFPPGSQAH